MRSVTILDDDVVAIRTDRDVKSDHVRVELTKAIVKYIEFVLGVHGLSEEDVTFSCSLVQSTFYKNFAEHTCHVTVFEKYTNKRQSVTLHDKVDKILMIWE